MAVLDPVKLVITDYPEGVSETVLLENNPNDETAVTRGVTFSREIYIERGDFMIDPPPKYHRLVPGGLVRLKGAYIVKCDRFDADGGGSVTCVYCTHYPESRSGSDTSGLKVKGVIHWVSAADSVDITVNKIDYLLTPAENGVTDFADRLNKNSKTVYNNAKGEKSLAAALALAPYQFMRLSYFCRDPKLPGELVFNEIVGLKESYKIT
jgi:glutaminyl-tRNA synthetase